MQHDTEYKLVIIALYTHRLKFENYGNSLKTSIIQSIENRICENSNHKMCFFASMCAPAAAGTPFMKSRFLKIWDKSFFIFYFTKHFPRGGSKHIRMSDIIWYTDPNWSETRGYIGDSKLQLWLSYHIHQTFKKMTPRCKLTSRFFIKASFNFVKLLRIILPW